MRFIIAAAALCVSACMSASPVEAPFEFVEPPEPRAWIGEATLSPEGLGGIRIGEGIAPVQAALDYRLEEGEPDPGSAGCDEWGIRIDWNASVSMLTEDNVVQRISIDGPTGIRTAEGIAVGDTVAQVLATYPNAERDSAEYVPAPGHELFVWTDRENYVGLRFEIGEDERVTDIHAGTNLRNDEGCATA